MFNIGKPTILVIMVALLVFSVVFSFSLSNNTSSSLQAATLDVTDETNSCLMCHRNMNPGIVEQWELSSHAAATIGCYECHQADEGEADAFDHNGYVIAVVVTPLDCSKCHAREVEEFEASHHSTGGNILASLDNFLAETVEGARMPFNPHSPTPGRGDVELVNGQASANSGCIQCHGAKLALQGTDGSKITRDELAPDEDGMPTNTEAFANIVRDDDGKPLYDPATWPNTGIGRLNLDGSNGSCSACHSRHDFSARRSRKPDNCGKCHQGPDHPQREIYEESKHGIAYLDLEEYMNLDGESWVLGEDYSQAPTCATCHMSANSKNGGRVTHDVGFRLSWNNKAPLSRWYDVDENGKIVTEADQVKREKLTDVSGWEKRERMLNVCTHCHSEDYVLGFYSQYDEFIVLYNEKFGKPGGALMKLLKETGVISKPNFDDDIEWVWWEVWHHQGRRARMGASMMGPDYAHWHGMYDVSKDFYRELIPQARELSEAALADGNAEAQKALDFIDDLLAREEHSWVTGGSLAGN